MAAEGKKGPKRHFSFHILAFHLTFSSKGNLIVSQLRAVLARVVSNPALQNTAFPAAAKEPNLFSWRQIHFPGGRSIFLVAEPFPCTGSAKTMDCLTTEGSHLVGSEALFMSNLHHSRRWQDKAWMAPYNRKHSGGNTLCCLILPQDLIPQYCHLH